MLLIQSSKYKVVSALYCTLEIITWGKKGKKCKELVTVRVGITKSDFSVILLMHKTISMVIVM